MAISSLDKECTFRPNINRSTTPSKPAATAKSTVKQETKVTPSICPAPDISSSQQSRSKPPAEIKELNLQSTQSQLKIKRDLRLSLKSSQPHKDIITLQKTSNANPYLDEPEPFHNIKESEGEGVIKFEADEPALEQEGIGAYPSPKPIAIDTDHTGGRREYNEDFDDSDHLLITPAVEDSIDCINESADQEPPRPSVVRPPSPEKGHFRRSTIRELFMSLYDENENKEL